MKRLQIYIEEEVDEALALMAARERTSKAALIRRFVAERLRASGQAGDDPLAGLIGLSDAEPADIDEVVYGG